MDADQPAGEVDAGACRGRGLPESVATNGRDHHRERSDGQGDVVGLQCWDLAQFGYGFVEVDVDLGTASISLKDEDGAVILSKGTAGNPCTITLGP